MSENTKNPAETEEIPSVSLEKQAEPLVNPPGVGRAPQKHFRLEAPSTFWKDMADRMPSDVPGAYAVDAFYNDKPDEDGQIQSEAQRAVLEAVRSLCKPFYERWPNFWMELTSPQQSVIVRGLMQSVSNLFKRYEQTIMTHETLTVVGHVGWTYEPWHLPDGEKHLTPRGMRLEAYWMGHQGADPIYPYGANNASMKDAMEMLTTSSSMDFVESETIWSKAIADHYPDVEETIEKLSEEVHQTFGFPEMVVLGWEVYASLKMAFFRSALVRLNPMVLRKNDGFHIELLSIVSQPAVLKIIVDPAIPNRVTVLTGDNFRSMADGVRAADKDGKIPGHTLLASF